MLLFLPKVPSGSMAGNVARLSNANVKVNTVFGTQISCLQAIHASSEQGIGLNCADFVVNEGFKSKS
ncbi:hypothetical protein DQ393_15570 [Rhizobium tropici]|uniref:Uncharacterized protein n=1 Tax=Rhizobium tropici TaxID=398 RepID=A0A329YFH8_RHITR|nr:hypothetical protein DQ393_15570 [Rhizobium tropici]